jgi:hypothetical protein
LTVSGVEQCLFGVGVIGVADDEIRVDRPARGLELEAAPTATDALDLHPRPELDTQLPAEFHDAVDDRPHATIGVMHAEVEIHVTHQVVDGGRVRRGAAEEN